MFDIDIDIVNLWQTEKEVDDNNLPAVCSKMSVFPSSPHLATKKVSRSPDIDKGRTMSMFCRPANYSSFTNFIYFHVTHKDISPGSGSIALWIWIADYFKYSPPSQTKTSGQNQPFLFLPASTAHDCRAWIISDHSKHCPSEHFYSFGSFNIFFFLIFCLQSTRVCMWLARAGFGTQDWFSLNISTNQGPRTLRRPVGKCRSAFDWWHATI